MEDDSSFYKKPGCGIWLFFFGMFAAFIAAFWKEIPLALFGWMNIFQFFLSDVPLDLSEETALAMVSVTLTVVAYLFILLISLFVVAQFALPVRSWQDRRKAFVRLLLYLVGWHGPAISVREGRVLSRQDETDSFAPGVALVDLSSAVVLEQQHSSAWGTNEWAQEQMEISHNTYNPWKLLRGNIPPWVRIKGPGIVFTQWGEKITTVVDLRKQIRTQLDVTSYTRDGIELNNIIFAVFSISESPDIIHVGYIGGKNKENIFGLVLDENKINNTVCIKEKYEIDPEDATEIHNYVVHGIEIEKLRLETTSAESNQFSKTPYPFDEQRVFKAAYARALVHGLSPDIATSTAWHELPQLVAVHIFRKQIERYNFDELFKMDEPDTHPLREFKEIFGRKVRFQGILSYKLVMPNIKNDSATTQEKWNELPFQEGEIGYQIDGKIPKKLWETSEIIFSPVRDFFASKTLRNRGIKIIAAGFPEFRPAQNAVKEKLIENWKARWERDVQIIKANHTLEAIRTKNRARSATQREMTYTLSSLFSSSAHTKEALALRILQSIEEAAASPSGKSALTPQDILNMLQNLQRWLLIGRKELERKSFEVEIQKNKLKNKPKPNENDKPLSNL
jgi:uncharacterized membrane protein YhaH (DUF805 family)